MKEHQKNQTIYDKWTDDLSYMSSVCWAWHHNVIEGHLDLLGTANLLFIIENYSVEVYSK